MTTVSLSLRQAAHLEPRFWAKVDMLGSCWEWQSAKTHDGYGTFGVGQTKAVAHRVSYELIAGPVPTGLELDHLCFNRSCVNPSHLEPVAHDENMRRASAGTKLRRDPHSKVTRRRHVPQSHCKRGHELVGANVRLINTGYGRTGRQCLTCYRNRKHLPEFDAGLISELPISVVDHEDGEFR